MTYFSILNREGEVLSSYEAASATDALDLYSLDYQRRAARGVSLGDRDLAYEAREGVTP